MLDFTKLGSQMQGFSRALAQEAVASQKRIDRAATLLIEARGNQAHWVSVQQQWHDRLGFTPAEPMEPLDTVQSVWFNDAPNAPIPNAYTVLATDGSQIAPSHHEIAFCYLLNIGRVALHYGQERYPLLDSVPEVFYQAEDLYGCRQWGISTEEWMGYCRTVLEAQVLAQLAHQFQPELPLLDPARSPQFALVDGSLVYWFLDGLPTAARDRLLLPILAAWRELQTLNIPLLGYISASRSGEALNFFRLLRCPHAAPDCDRYCGGQTDKAPCQVLAPLKDATFWQTRLQPGDRGPIWKSHARILSLYGEAADPHRDQSIYFCHLHVGSEVARIEFPAWVAADPQQLQQALALVLSQVQKGYGYPIALAEAHNQAVVRAGDRRRFFALLEQEMVQAGLKNVGTSYKETRKRESIA